jgi:transposase
MPPAQAKIFTIAKRERFLALYERGATRANAAKDVGVSTTTISAWVKDGKDANDDSDKAVFARRYLAIKQGSGPVELTRSDLVQMLEERARNGVVRAIELLLTKPWEIKVAEQSKEEPKATFADELAARRAL